MTLEEIFPENLRRLWQEMAEATVPRGWINIEGGGVEQQWNRRLFLWHCANYAGALTIFSQENRNLRILELGCGSGALTQAFARVMPPGWCLVATDYSPRLIEFARVRNSGFTPQDLELEPRLQFACLNAQEIRTSFLLGFDGVMFLEVIEHLPSRSVSDLLTRLERGLKPGGLVVFTTPDRSPFPRPFSGYVYHQIEFRYETLREFLSNPENNPFRNFQIFRLVSPKIIEQAVKGEQRGGYFLNRLFGVVERLSARSAGLRWAKEELTDRFYRLTGRFLAQKSFDSEPYLKDIRLVTEELKEYDRQSFSLIAVLRK